MSHARVVQVWCNLDFQCCDQYPLQAQPSSKNLERWLTSDDKPLEEFEQLMLDVFNSLWHIATNEQLKFCFRDIQKRVAPAEFVFTGEHRPA